MNDFTRAPVLMPRFRRKEFDLIGKTFGRLTAVAKLTDKADRYKCLCTCSCGNTVKINKYSLLNGATKSCGCRLADSLAISGLVAPGNLHGTPKYAVYVTWRNMWDRCTRTTRECYRLYKERTPPEEWKDFTVFFAHVGLKPGPEYSLDRIDNEKGYAPGNVRWATREEQNNNTRHTRLLTYAGKDQTLSEWAADLGVPRKILYERLYSLKWSVERTLSTPT